MNKQLKYLYLISLFSVILTSNFFGNNDSLKNSKGYFSINSNFGVSVYNKLFIENNYKSNSSNTYIINSTPMIYYNFGLEYNIKRVRLDIAASYMSGEYKGENFEYNIINYGPQGNNSILAKYSIYQKTKYQTSLIMTSFGVNLYNNERHKLYLKGIINYVINQKNTINNYYSRSQYGYDTTNYSLTKNKITKTKNINLPFFGIALGYETKIFNNFYVNINLSSFYLIYKGNKIDNNYVENAIVKGISDTREAYNVYRQIVILPQIGLKYKLIRS